jgi:hypothetical protein
MAELNVSNAVIIRFLEGSLGFMAFLTLAVGGFSFFFT